MAVMLPTQKMVHGTLIQHHRERPVATDLSLLWWRSRPLTRTTFRIRIRITLPTRHIHPRREVEPLILTMILPLTFMDLVGLGVALRVLLLIVTMSTRALLTVLPVTTTLTLRIPPTRPRVLTRRDTIRTTLQEDTTLLISTARPITDTPLLNRTRNMIMCSRTTTQIVMVTI